MKKSKRGKARKTLLSKRTLIFVIVQIFVIVIFGLYIYSCAPATKMNTERVSGNVEKIEYHYYKSYYKGAWFKRRVLVVYIDGIPYNLGGKADISKEATYTEILKSVDVGDEITIQYINQELFPHKLVVDMRDGENVFRSIKAHNQAQIPLMILLIIIFIVLEFVLVGFFYYPIRVLLLLRKTINNLSKHK